MLTRLEYLALESDGHGQRSGRTEYKGLKRIQIWSPHPYKYSLGGVGFIYNPFRTSLAELFVSRTFASALVRSAFYPHLSIRTP